MAHVTRDKKKLLNRVGRIKGQLSAIERGLDEEAECATILQTAAACRGAIQGLVAELLEGHIRHHVLDPDRRPSSAQAKSAQELIDVVRTYLR